MTDTALDLVTDALKDLGVVASGETAEAAQALDALRALNDLLDAWSTEGLTVFRIAQVSHAFVASKGSYTIGQAGGEDVNAARPVSVEDGSFVRDASSSDHRLIVLPSRVEYDAIASKSSESTYPGWVFYDPAYPSGTLYYWPVPDTALTAHLNVPAALTAFGGLDETVSFPPGYRRALRRCGAVEMQDVFGGALSPAYLDSARQAKAAIQRRNLVNRKRAVRFPARLRRGGRMPGAAQTAAGEHF